jgi:hypothetical protein
MQREMRKKWEWGAVGWCRLPQNETVKQRLLDKPFGKALLHLSKSVPAPIPPANSDLRSSRYRPAGGWTTWLLDLMTMRVLH